MTLPQPENVIINEITVCYQLTSNESCISHFKLTEIKTKEKDKSHIPAGHPIIRHDDATNLDKIDHEWLHY